MPVLLQKWETLISTTLNPSSGISYTLTDEWIQDNIHQSQLNKESLKTLLIEGVIDRQKIIDKQHYIQIHQAILIRLLDKLHHYKQLVEPDSKLLYLYNAITQDVENVLNYIEDFFSSYVDRNERVPAMYFEASKEEFRRQLQELEAMINEKKMIDSKLSHIILRNFEEFCSNQTSRPTYYELFYQKNLLNELLSSNSLNTKESVQEILFYFNFNDDNYVIYFFEKLQALTEPLTTQKEKIATLRYEQKVINQLRIRLDYTLIAGMPSLKEQLSSWIDEEIKFLETDAAPAILNKADSEHDEKINTSLSVAKLALLLRLMVIDKIITNRVIAQMLRVVVRMFATLQTENIAFGSLETKYHNPDRGTISAVKDMLFRWINILNKL